jgi:hypothetical protein
MKRAEKPSKIASIPLGHGLYRLLKERLNMFIILNWWYDETIANALPVMKDDGSGETMVFDSRTAANNYAKKELNGHWKVVEG